MIEQNVLNKYSILQIIIHFRIKIHFRVQLKCNGAELGHAKFTFLQNIPLMTSVVNHWAVAM